MLQLISRGSLLLLFIYSALSAADFKLIKHPVDQGGSRCLDGSPSALYVYQGQIKNKLLIYFEMGTMCEGLSLNQTVNSCFQISKTLSGSSSQYPQVVNFDEFTFLSEDQDQNPLYFAWTKIFIPFCDGSGHHGSRAAPLNYQSKLLYLRGTNNTLYHFQYLQDHYNLPHAEKVVISGTREGALASLLWANNLYNRIKNPDGVLVIADSGVYAADAVLTPGYKRYQIFIDLISKELPYPAHECYQVYKGLCYWAGILADFIQPPVVIIQSQYDLFALKKFLNLNCTLGEFPGSIQNCSQAQIIQIQKYRNLILESIANYTKGNKNAVWAISCVQNGFLFNYKFYDSEEYLIPAKTGKTILQTLAGFVMRAGKRINIDEKIWPNNQGCNGKITYEPE